MTSDDLLLTIPAKEGVTTWNLGQVLVIKNLGADVLVGEPAKVKNQIITNPTLQQATSMDGNSKRGGAK